MYMGIVHLKLNMDLVCSGLNYAPARLQKYVRNFDSIGVTMQELLTRHKSTVAEFLSKNYDWVITVDIILLFLSLWQVLIFFSKLCYSMPCQFEQYELSSLRALQTS